MKKRKILLLVLVFMLIVFISAFDLRAFISSRIEGVVVDKATGKPVKGVEIRVYCGKKRDGHGYFYTKTRTDQEGKFTIEANREAYYFIVYYPPSPYAQTNRREEYKKNLLYVRKGKTIKLRKELKKGGTILIKVKDRATGEGINDVYIDFNMFGDDYARFDFKVRRIGNGLFMNNQLYKGNYKISISRDGYWRKVKEFKINYGEKKEVEVYFDSNNLTGIEGKVICKETGKPPLKAGIVAVDKKDEYFDGVSSDKNGYFKIIDMNEGEYTVKFYKKGTSDEDCDWIEKKIVIKRGKLYRINAKINCVCKPLR